MHFTFWGWDVAFDGQMQGDMNVKLVLDDREMALNPSDGSLFSIKDLDNLQRHSLSLTVQNASAGSLLSVNQARINASTFSDQITPSAQWDLPSNDGVFSYTGFVQQQSAGGSPSPTTYTSSAIGDTASVTFNGSTVLVYGPCGPSSGLIRVTIDDTPESVNTTTPVASSNCILYQSRGYSALNVHKLVVENQDGKPLSINHMSFFRVIEYSGTKSGANIAAVVGGVIGGIVFVAFLIVLYSMRSRQTRQKINKSFSTLCS